MPDDAADELEPSADPVEPEGAIEAHHIHADVVCTVMFLREKDHEGQVVSQDDDVGLFLEALDRSGEKGERQLAGRMRANVHYVAMKGRFTNGEHLRREHFDPKVDGTTLQLYALVCKHTKLNGRVYGFFAMNGLERLFVLSMGLRHKGKQKPPIEKIQNAAIRTWKLLKKKYPEVNHDDQ